MSFERGEIIEGVCRVRQILGTGIFDSARNAGPLQQSAFLALVVYVRDLLAKCDLRNRRISFTEDVDLTSDCEDVTDLIRIVRDAACHIDSGKRNIGNTGNRGAFNVLWGKGATLRFESLILESKYDNDVCVYYGARRIYLRRHLIRAFDAAVFVFSEDPDLANILPHLR